MIALILAHPHIFWLSLGGLLLAAEMLGGNGYLLWSGIAGVVTAIGDNFITVEVADNVRIRVQKGAIGNVLPKGTLKSAA